MKPGRQGLSLFGGQVAVTQATKGHLMRFTQMFELMVQAEFVPFFKRKRHAGGHDKDLHDSTHDFKWRVKVLALAW